MPLDSRYTDFEYSPVPVELRGRDGEFNVMPTQSLHHKRHRVLFSRYRGQIVCIAFLVLGIMLGSVLGRWSSKTVVIGAPETHQESLPLTILDSFQDINHMSPAHVPITSSLQGNEKAIVTSLYNDGYTIAVSTLGHSLSKVDTTARKILIYLPDRISPYSLCHVQAAGWELHPVEYVPPPHNGQDVNWMFVDQYTKLRIWTLDQIGIKAAVYLDADTLVKNNFDELFESPFEFGAVPDVYLDSRGFTIGFNAGVLALKPDTRVFEDMMSKVEDARYSLGEAEQSYLNLYFGQQVVRLPHVYNGNLAIKARSRSYWDAIQAQMRIVHFTLVKPFNGRPWCGDDGCKIEEIFDPEKHKEHLNNAKEAWGGTFREEIEWWATVYEETMEKVGDTCKTHDV